MKPVTVALGAVFFLVDRVAGDALAAKEESDRERLHTKFATDEEARILDNYRTLVNLAERLAAVVGREWGGTAPMELAALGAAPYPYGYLTLYGNVFASASRLMTLDPKSFYPPPKVKSAVVVLDPQPPSFGCDRDLLLDLISTSFRMRRKKLVNNLTNWRDRSRDEILAAIERAGLSPDVRAEQMSLSDFDRLCRQAG